MDYLGIASRLVGTSLTAQSVRMKIASENLANFESTGHFPGAEPYTRKLVTFDTNIGHRGTTTPRVRSIELDSKPFPVELRPGHPAADENGFLKLPNVDPIIEIADLKEAGRSYQANLQTMKQIRELVSMTLDLLKG